MTHRPRRRHAALLAAVALCFPALAACTEEPERPRPAKESERKPVVFVHGYLADGSVFADTLQAYRDAGYADDELHLYEYDSHRSNKDSAQGLSDLVDQVREDSGSRRVDMVGHSMGVLVSLWYLKELDGTRYVEDLAAVAGAHGGSKLFEGCTGGPACREMIPGDDVLTTLAADDPTPGPTDYRTWYSRCDGVIDPWKGSALKGAENTELPCMEHLAFLSDGEVLDQVVEFTSS